jgi:hypothetical protein
LRRCVYDYGSREADREQRRGECRKAIIVEHEAEGGGDHPDGKGVNLRPQQVIDGSDEGENAECLIAEEKDRNLPRHAGGRLEPGFTGKPHRRILDHEIAQKQRIAERRGTECNQQIGDAGRRQEGSRMHGRNLPRPWLAPQWRG